MEFIKFTQKLSDYKYYGFLKLAATYRKLFSPKYYVNSGVKIEIDYDFYPKKIINHMLAGFYETDELFVIKNIIGSDERVVDIGAGIGFVSAFIAKNLSEIGSIECFEANPMLIEKIKKNHAINNVKIQVNNEILSHSKGDQCFHVHEEFWASSLIPSEQSVNTIVVQKRLFQEYLDDKKPTMIVVDIEGGEVELFRDINLDSVNKICIELHPNISGWNEMNEMLESFKEQGFSIEEKYSTRAVKALLRV